jgi:hypothetical protein
MEAFKTTMPYPPPTNPQVGSRRTINSTIRNADRPFVVPVVQPSVCHGKWEDKDVAKSKGVNVPQAGQKIK